MAVELDAAETEALLRDIPAAYRTRIEEVLLTALGQAVAEWTGDRRVSVALEGHGREEQLFDGIDLTRTVGWFTTLYPVGVDVNGDGASALKAVKEQLRAVPRHGIGYGVLRHLAGDNALGEAHPQLSFNYLGQLDAAAPDAAPATALAPAPESPGPLTGAGGRRAHLIDVNGAVTGGRLSVAWTYSRNLHDRATVTRVAERFTDRLRDLIDHCTTADAGGLTPSDVPLAGLDAEELESLLDDLEEDEA